MDEIHPIALRRFPLGIWLAIGFGSFVLAGSVAMVGFFQHLGRMESRIALESLGRTNALFLDQSTLPQSSHMAVQLGRVMGAEVGFHDPKNHPQGWIADGRASLVGNHLHVGFVLRSGREVWFTREASPQGLRALWARTDARFALVGFWLLALIPSLWLARMVTHPLAKLEAALPMIGGNSPPGPLPDQGPREIVRLATALRSTHDAILEEREKRRHAERLALLGQMAASLAHEIRNPVAAIRLHAQLIEMAAAPPVPAAPSAKLILAETTRIESLINQWLHFAKPGPIARSSVDVAALTADVVHMLEPQAAHSGVTIRIEPAPHPGTPVLIAGDRERIRQVLGNLLLNAIQSMPTGGRVAVRIAPDMLEIDDEGTGFSVSALKAAGTAFYSEREGGMGLGLAVAKEILEAHGASLHVENLPERGARLRIIWPPIDSHGRDPDH